MLSRNGEIWEKLNSEEAHVHSVRRVYYALETGGQSVSVVETAHGRTLVIDGRLQSTEADEWIYHEALVQPAMLCHDGPTSALCVGGTTGAIIREVLRMSTIQCVAFANTSRVLVDTTQAYLPHLGGWVFDDPRVELVEEDASSWLQRSGRRFDVIIIDLPESPDGTPMDVRFVTRRLLIVLRQHLNFGGIIAVAGGAAHPLAEPTFAVTVRALKSIFRSVDAYTANVSSLGTPWGFAVGTDGPPISTFDAEVIDQRINERQVTGLRYYEGRLHAAMLALPRHLDMWLSTAGCETQTTQKAGETGGIDIEPGVPGESTQVGSGLPSSVVAVKTLYDSALSSGDEARGLVFPRVLGEGQFVGQYSDNSADDILRLATRAQVGSSTHVLDIGCGACGPASFLVESLGCRVTGVDLSARHIAAARERVTAKGLVNRMEILEGDIYKVGTSLPRADVVIGLGAWCHFDPKELFPVCRALLKPGGRIAFMERVLLGSVDNALWRQLTHEWACPSVESFSSYYEALMSNGFTNVYIEDRTPAYVSLQQRFVDVRLELKEQLVEILGEEGFERDLALVQAECQATLKGQLGYGLFVAKRAP